MQQQTVQQDVDPRNVLIQEIANMRERVEPSVVEGDTGGEADSSSDAGADLPVQGGDQKDMPTEPQHPKGDDPYGSLSFGAEGGSEQKPEEGVTKDEQVPAQPRQQQQQQSQQQQQQQQQEGDENASLLHTLASLAREDDYLRAALAYYAKNKDLSGFLQSTSVDVDSMDDMAVLRYAMQREAPEVDDDVLRIMVERELERYGYSELPEDKQQKLLRAVADKRRRELKAERERLIREYAEALPVPEPQQDQGQQQQQLTEEQLRAIQEQIAWAESHPVTKEVTEHKRVTIRYNGREVPLPVPQPEEVVQTFTDATPMFRYLVDSHGRLDVGKLAMVMSLLQNPDRFVSSLVGAGRTMAIEELATDGAGVQRQAVEPAARQTGSDAGGGEQDQLKQQFLRALHKV